MPERTHGTSAITPVLSSAFEKAVRFCGFGRGRLWTFLIDDPLADQIKKLFCASFEIFPFLKPPSVAIRT